MGCGLFSPALPCGIALKGILLRGTERIEAPCSALLKAEHLPSAGALLVSGAHDPPVSYLSTSEKKNKWAEVKDMTGYHCVLLNYRQQIKTPSSVVAVGKG